MRTYLDRNQEITDILIKALETSKVPPHLLHYLPQIESSAVLSKLALARGQFFLVSALGEENVDDEGRFNYEGSSVSHKVLRVILSYIDHVNRNVWQKWSDAHSPS